MLSRKAQRRGSIHQVLSAAKHLFGTVGFAKTTVKDIAATAGLSVGTVMSVGDKNALLVAVFDNQIAEIHRDRPDPSPISEARCADRLAALFTPFAELFTQQPELSRTYAAILISGHHSSRVFSELAATLTAEIAAELRRCRQLPMAEDERVQDARAKAIYLAYLGLLFTWPPALDRDTSALIATLHELSASLLHSCCPAVEAIRE